MAGPESTAFGRDYRQVRFGGTARDMFHLLFTRTPEELDDISQADSCIAWCITDVLLINKP